VANTEEKLKVRYSRLSKIFILISIIFALWVIYVGLSVSMLNMGPNWTGLSFEYWIYLWCVIALVFIVLEVIFFFHFKKNREKKITSKPTEPEYINGKRLFVYTHPKGVEGGIFSKTYVNINGNSVLRLRSLMIPPKELENFKK